VQARAFYRNNGRRSAAGEEAEASFGKEERRQAAALHMERARICDASVVAGAKEGGFETRPYRRTCTRG